MEINNYSTIADMKDYWVNTIAPKYLDLENTNLYSVGIFGYINELMASIAEDTFNSINIARNEFYPVKANYQRSLNSMAVVQGLDISMVKPATANILILIPEDDILKKGEQTGDTIKYIIDNTLVAKVDNLDFMLEFPVIILAKQVSNKWSYTIHYDSKVVNAIAESPSKYVQNKIIRQNGQNILLLSVKMRQMTRTDASAILTKGSIIETCSADFPFTGDLANFEVFYRANEDDAPIQLLKALKGTPTLEEPYCTYEIINKNTIRLIFQYNNYFTPEFNSIIDVNIYTSLGTKGEFVKFDGDVTFIANSEKYPYNAETFMVGVCNGSAKGASDKVSMEDFRREILDAYATNKTITTPNDLQIMFNQQSTENNWIYFQKKRDDVAFRLFGAYNLMKTEDKYVVPTNTLDMELTKDDFDDYYEASKRLILKPGTVFEYKAPDSFTVKKSADKTIDMDLDQYEDTDFLYTNPFLISVTTSPNNLVGYYLNSVNHTLPLQYTHVNDNSHLQFIANNLMVNRNALLGEEYYTFSISIAPSTDLDPALVCTKEATPTTFTTTKKGRVDSTFYRDGKVWANLIYDDNTNEELQISNAVINQGGNFVYETGYDFALKTGDTFAKDEVIATKKITDLGNVRLIGTFNLGTGDIYIPFTLSEHNEEINYFTYTAHISTTDYISLSKETVIDRGLYTGSTGAELPDAAIKFADLQMVISVFHNYSTDVYTNPYSTYKYLEGFNISNSYSQFNDETFDLIVPVEFIRSPLVYTIPGGGATVGTNLDGVTLHIKNSPLVKSNWLKLKKNSDYFIDTIYDNYNFLKEKFLSLEQNYSIDLKLYNTYGKSKYYRVGLRGSLSQLDKVNCSINFGVKINILTNAETFRNNFIAYVREYIEGINSVNDMGGSIYMMNMISDIKENFEEIEYIEYYGFNEYDYSIQKIESYTSDEITEIAGSDYVPEFINIYSKQEKGINTPKVGLTFL